MAPVAVSPATSSPGASMPGSPAEEAVATPSTDSSGFSGGPVGGYANGNGNGVHHRNGIDGFVNGHSNGHSANGHGPDGHAPNGHTNGYFASGGGHYGVGGLNIATSPDGFVDSPRTAGTTTAATSPPPSPLPAAAAAAAPLPAHPDPSKPIPIAIIGMACRLPGDVSSPAEFWELCARARTGFSAVPPSTRFDTAAFWHPNPGKAGTMSPEGGNFIKQDPALFDAPFFSMTAQEATSLDPQQRLLLECTFEALENAGIPRHDIVGKDVGVFVGGSFSEYESSLFRDTDYIAMHQATGCAHAMQSNRISHFFDLRGPSFTSDTACSSSLVALHCAAQSLRAKESSIALVGGCHLNMLPEFWISFSKSRLLSDTGRSISFDNRGTGFGRGEGCGMIVMKPLEAALRDNDSIRAVIVGSGLNQDGKTPGITMPNGSAQEALMRKVYDDAGIDPADCGFVEAHGTGTKVGDPIEATAIHNVLGQGRSKMDPLWIGSIKSNIGHLEAASGIAGVIKAAMMLERGFILPNYNFKQPNSKIPWNDWHLKVPVSQRPWPRNKKYISVNNFGFGGTNAHVVLERASFASKKGAGSGMPGTPASSVSVADRPPPSRKLFAMTGNDRAALEQVMKNTVVYLEQRPEIFQLDLMDNLAYTYGQRRSLLQWRVAIPALSSFELIETINGGKCSPGKETEPLRLGLVFTGQGAQWNAMGRELYHQYPVFAAALDRADACLAAQGAEWSLVEELAKDAKASQVGAAHISQPACTAVQLALVELLRAWGVFPAAVTGHSSGEIAAAYSAGILTFDAAMAIAYHRGRLIPTLKERFADLRGAMMAVGATKDEVAPLIGGLTEGVVKIACYNSPSSLTISGDEPAIEELGRLCEEKGMFNRRLLVDTAYHSHHMNLVAKDYRESIASTDPPMRPAPGPDGDATKPVAFYSSLLGREADYSELHPGYWVENLTCPVRFDEALQSMLVPSGDEGRPKSGVNMLVELGPHSALQGPIKQILKAVGGSAAKLPYASALLRKRDAVETALELAGALFVRGAALDFEAINFPRMQQPASKEAAALPTTTTTMATTKQPSLLTDLPRYPWNYSSRYWQESRLTLAHKTRTTPRSDLLGAPATWSNDLDSPQWRNVLRLDDVPWLRHHRVQGLTVFPFSAFIGMALEAAAQRAAAGATEYDAFELRDVAVLKPLVLPDDTDVEMTLSLRASDDGPLTASETWHEFRIFSWTLAAGWTEHCKGFVAALKSDAHDAAAKHITDTADAALLADAADVCHKDMYAALSDLGADLGTVFQGVEAVRAVDGFSTAALVAPDVAKEMPHHYLAHTDVVQPALLESLVELYWPALGAGRKGSDEAATLYLPSSVARLVVKRSITELTREPGSRLKAWCAAPGLPSPAGQTPKPTAVSMVAATEDGAENVLVIEGLLVAPILDGPAGGAAADANAPRELCYKLEWEAAEQPAASSAFPDADVAILRAPADPAQHLLAVSLAAELEHATGRRPVIGTLLGSASSSDEEERAIVSAQGKFLIVLSELAKPLLPRISEPEFVALRKLLVGEGGEQGAQGVLWVVRGAYDSDVSGRVPGNPEANMVTGMARSIRSETALRFATLDLDASDARTGLATADAVLKAFRLAHGSAADAAYGELEFAERAGVILTPRIVHDAETDADVHRQTNHAALEPAPFAQGGRRLRMVAVPEAGESGLHFVDDAANTAAEDGGPQLPDGEVEIEVKAVGVNHRDTAASTPSSTAEPSRIGCECAGVVLAVGKGVTTVRPGDRVAALTLDGRGAYSTVTRVPAAMALPISESMPFEAAASLPLAYATAYYALVTLGRLDKGESVLIHAAAGAVGQAAVHLAKHILGADGQIYATAGSAEKRKFVEEALGVPADRIFDSRRPASFAAGVRAATRDQGGVDVVLHTLPAQGALRDSWSCLNKFGRLLDVGKSDGVGSSAKSSATAARLDVDRADSNATLASVDIAALAASRPAVVARLVSDVAALLACAPAAVTPLAPLHVAPMAAVDAQLRELAAGGAHGKFVVVPGGKDDLVRATPSRRAQDRLLRGDDATYVLIGGTGGLGRSMARWMVGKGARTVVLVSRSGGVGKEVQDLMDEVRDATDGKGRVVVKRCDVADPDAMLRLFKTELAGLPPVRGVVHGTMVLRDVLFEKMTHAEWTQVVEGKVAGGWNLHAALQAVGAPLDFFVAISSAAGAVGNRGQAAYAAANCYLNALVSHRRALGLPAASLDLTAVSDAGYLAANAEKAAEVMRTLGGDSICEAEVLALLGAAVQGKLERNCAGHAITGMRISAALQPFWTADAKFRALRVAAEEEAKLLAQNSAAAAVVSHHAALKAAAAAADPVAAEKAVCDGLVDKISAVLLLERDDMDVTRSLSHYPLDSLVAIEIRNFITREFEANMQVLELLSSGSIQTLARTVCAKSKLVTFGK